MNQYDLDKELKLVKDIIQECVYWIDEHQSAKANICASRALDKVEKAIPMAQRVSGNYIVWRERRCKLFDGPERDCDDVC